MPNTPTLDFYDNQLEFDDSFLEVLKLIILPNWLINWNIIFELIEHKQILETLKLRVRIFLPIKNIKKRRFRWLQNDFIPSIADLRKIFG